MTIAVALLRLIRLADLLGQHFLRPRLDLGIERQLQVLALLRAADRVALDLLSEPVHSHGALPAGGAEQIVVGGLQPGQALVVDPDRPDHLSRQLPLRVDPPGGRHRDHPGDVELSHPLGGGEIDFAGQVGKSRGTIGQGSKDVGLADVERRGQAPGGCRGMLDLIRGCDHVGGVLGDGQPPPLSIQDPPALPGNGHGLGVLASGIGAEPAPLDSLHPGRTADREAEQQQEAGEQQADPTLDHGVVTPSERVSSPAASRRAAVAASLGLRLT